MVVGEVAAGRGHARRDGWRLFPRTKASHRRVISVRTYNQNLALSLPVPTPPEDVAFGLHRQTTAGASLRLFGHPPDRAFWLAAGFQSGPHVVGELV